MRPMLVLVVLLDGLSLTGCSDTLHLYSSPPGANVAVDGRPIGVTPTQFAIGRFERWPNQVTFEKVGYEPKAEPVTTRRSIGRVITWGFLAHPATALEFDTINVKLKEKPEPVVETSEEPEDESPGTRLREIQRLYDEKLIDRAEYQKARSEVLKGL